MPLESPPHAILCAATPFCFEGPSSSSRPIEDQGQSQLTWYSLVA